MADKKASVKKPAPKKDTPSGPENDGHAFAKSFFGLCFALLIFFTAIDKLPFLSSVPIFSNDPETNEPASISQAIPSGDVFLGSKVVTKSNTAIRTAPGARKIEDQKKGSKGKVIDGPVSVAGGTYYRISFENPPSGWVLSDKITTHIGLYTLLNIFPIVLDFLRPFFIILSIFFIILYIFYRLKEEDLEKEQDLKRKVIIDQNIETGVGVKGDGVADTVEEIIPRLPQEGGAGSYIGSKNERWDHVKMLTQSYSQNDWRQAIIEADIILEDLLDKMGYQGFGVGEKLKNVEPSDFNTLNDAWEAHKARNIIAHRGSDFSLSRDEVDRIMKLYENVFREFYFI